MLISAQASTSHRAVLALEVCPQPHGLLVEMAGATDAEQGNGTGFCPVGESGAYEIAGLGRTGDTGGDDLIVGLGQFYGGEVFGGKRAGLSATG